MPHYRILPGASFRDIDDTIKGGGDLIELPEDLAEHHSGKIDPNPLTAEEVAQHVADRRAVQPAAE